MKPKHKVGDKVRVTKVIGDNVYEDLVGFVGIVEDIEEANNGYVYSLDGAIVSEDQLEEVKGE